MLPEPCSSASSFCLNDYDVIGFDLDHTLCKYKLKALFQLGYEILVNYLVDKHNFGREIFKNYETAAQFFQKGLVFDLKRGNFLKLAEDFTILRATHGTRVMSGDEICLTYGPEKIWEPSVNILHGLCFEKSFSKPYRSPLDHFLIPVPFICASIVDDMDLNSGSASESYHFWIDVFECVNDMYKRESFKNNEGGFFPAMKKNISLYVEKCSPETLEWLRNLKAHKKVFLLTGSHIDYADYLLTYIIGSNWREYFNICITYARKPNFFFENNSFLQLDGCEETLPADLLSENENYSQGNWTQLKDFFSRECDTSSPRFLYFGDIITYDVFAGKHLNCCDGVAIIEEMAAEGMLGVETSAEESREELNSEIWGSFFVDTVGGVTKRSFWSSVVMKYGRLAIPSLSAISSLPLEKKINSFTSQCSTNDGGYYPGVPRVLQDLEGSGL